MSVRPLNGDCLRVMRLMALYGVQVDSIVTDPPYHLTSIVKRFGNGEPAHTKTAKDIAARSTPIARLARGFMGKQWDGGNIAADPETWRLAYDVLKPGGHLVAFGGTRTYHRMVCAIEDAGFEIRDQLAWMFGSGFPKSHDVSKAIDKAAGVEFSTEPASGVGFMGPDGPGGYNVTKNKLTRDGEMTEAAREWEGWGTALKPAHEPICLARKPLSEKSVAANVLEHGTGAVNVDGCRVEGDMGADRAAGKPRRNDNKIFGTANTTINPQSPLGRWPANVLHDGSDEVVGMFPQTDGQQRATGPQFDRKRGAVYGEFAGVSEHSPRGDSGSAARFFYSAHWTGDDLWNDNALNAGATLSLASDDSVIALNHAVASATPELALKSTSYRAPSTNVTVSELNNGCASVITAIQNIALKSSLGLPPESITVNSGHAKCVATPKPTDITTITISLWLSDGCAEPVTFNTMPQNTDHGAKVSVSRLHYSAKAGPDDRYKSKHPTVKPVSLMRWLVRLVTPPGGLVLDPFAGTGSTGIAAIRESMRAILIEREAEYFADIKRRIAALDGSDAPLFSGEPEQADIESLL